jgi:Mg2+-importing ATPase
MATTAGIILVGVWLPSSSLGPALGFTHLPHLYWPLIALTLFAYVGLTQVVKVWLHHRRWI